MSENMGDKKPLFTKRGKIVFCHMCSGINLIIHIAIIVLTVKILLDVFGINSFREAGFIILLLLSLALPFVLHAFYILWFQTGYVVFHSNSVDIVTKFKTRTFPDNMYVFMEVKTHSVKESKVPMYYEIKLDFKLDDKKEVVRLFTNQLYCFDELIKRFPEVS